MFGEGSAHFSCGVSGGLWCLRRGGHTGSGDLSLPDAPRCLAFFAAFFFSYERTVLAGVTDVLPVMRACVPREASAPSAPRSCSLR